MCDRVPAHFIAMSTTICAYAMHPRWIWGDRLNGEIKGDAYGGKLRCTVAEFTLITQESISIQITVTYGLITDSGTSIVISPNGLGLRIESIIAQRLV